MVQRNHMMAIQTRLLRVLPVYEENLGEHPFTATTLSWIGNSYYALGDYDNAIKYNSRSISIRRKLLGQHQETAKSLYALSKLIVSNIDLCKNIHSSCICSFKQFIVITATP